MPIEGRIPHPHSLGDFVGRADPTDWLCLRDHLRPDFSIAAAGVSDDQLRHRRTDRPWADGIHANAGFGILQRCRTGELKDTGLGRDISRLRMKADQCRSWKGLNGPWPFISECYANAIPPQGQGLGWPDSSTR